ncbi:MAG: hypothetical protein DMD84_28605 [Candidatus Rokuibacteriota bacterium]|nr:MAG: hypothetical protein DMD84_28605 [Candidatus Rokubacteria bacterium]
MKGLARALDGGALVLAALAVAVLAAGRLRLAGMTLERAEDLVVVLALVVGARLALTPVPLYQMVPTRWHGRALAAVHALSAHTARALPRLLAYQFLVGATHDRER